jgi:hypothetical protein
MGSARGRRHLPKRVRLRDVSDGWHPAAAEVDEVIELVTRAGAAHVLEELLARRSDARQRLSVLGLEVARVINASRDGHKGSRLELLRILNGLPKETLARLGMDRWRRLGGYDAVQRLTVALGRVLDEGVQYRNPATGETVICDWAWHTQSMLLGTIPASLLDAMVGNTALAVDGTEMESCGQFHGELSATDADGEAAGPDDPEAIASVSTRRRKIPTKAKVLGIGADGRKIYTKDDDARAGWRTGNAKHAAGYYIGREVHLGVAVSSIVRTDGVHWVKFGPEVPPVIITADVVPAGTHRAKAVVPSLLEAASAGLCADVVADAGYTNTKPDTFALPLQRAGVPITLRLVPAQRGEKPGVGAARQIDGHLFAAQLPEDLVNPPMPPLGASNDEKAPYIAQFNRRAPYRYARIKAPGSDGTTRWEHPVNSGTLRSRQVPRSMRNSTKAPLIKIEEGANLHSVTAGADDLATWQRTLFGTSAWHEAMGRRQQVESVNSFLHGAVGSLTDISRGYTKLRHSGRIKLFLVATLVGYNRKVIARWEQDHGSVGSLTPLPGAPKRRAPRRDRARHYEDLPAIAG